MDDGSSYGGNCPWHRDHGIPSPSSAAFRANIGSRRNIVPQFRWFAPKVSHNATSMSESSAGSTVTEEDLLIEIQERGSYQVTQGTGVKDLTRSNGELIAANTFLGQQFII